MDTNVSYGDKYETIHVTYNKSDWSYVIHMQKQKKKVRKEFVSLN